MDTHRMVRVVETQTANRLYLLARERREEVLHGQDGARYLRSRVQNGPDDLVRLDDLLVPGSKTD